MSSSISNSRRAFVIAALVVAAFASIELVTRRYLFASSKDLKRFSTYAQRAAELVRSDKPSVAFVGNSITERGIDPDLIANELAVFADVLVADDSHLNTWTWMVQSLFWKRDLTPDLLVIPFYGHSLEDDRGIELGRLAQFFTTPADWPELFETTTTTLGARAELIASSYWATYAVRDRLRERLLGLAPGYKQLVAFERPTTEPPAAVARTPRWRILTRFLDRARTHHARVLFVAFPTRTHGSVNPYEVDSRVVRLLEQAGVELLDLRRLPLLDPARHYDDDIHLNPVGKAIFTHELARHLALKIRG